MSLLRAVATVGSYTLISRILGFARDILMTAFLGVSASTDAFFVAFRLPNLFRRFFAEGAFNAAFVPVFSEWLVKKGHDWAKSSAEMVFVGLLLALTVLVLVFEFVMPWVVQLIAPGFTDTPARYELTVYLAYITFPYILFISLAAFFAGILNSFGRFASAAGAPIVLNVCMITALVMAYYMPGEDSHLLAWSVFIGGMGQLLLLWWAARRVGMDLGLRRPRLTPEVKKVIRLGLPGAMGAGVYQVNILISTLFASLLPTGAVSYLFYADRLNQFPLAIIGVAVTTALLPQLSQQIKSEKMKAAYYTQNRSLEFAMLLTLPATVALLVLAQPFVQALFERGEFTATDTYATAMTLAAYVVGLPAYVLVKVFSTPFFARQDTTTPVVAGSLSLGVALILNFVLIGPLHYIGLALSISIAAWVNAFYLTYRLYKKDWLRLDDRVRGKLPRLVISSVLMGVVLWNASGLLEGWLQRGLLYTILYLAVVIPIGLLAYCVSALLLRGIEIAEVKSALQRV